MSMYIDSVIYTVYVTYGPENYMKTTQLNKKGNLSQPSLCCFYYELYKQWICVCV